MYCVRRGVAKTAARFLQMWYTLVIILDIFLAWLITNSLISIFQWCFPFFPHAFPTIVMRSFHIPEGFIHLALYLPNALLVGLYYMFRLPKCNAFRHWHGWEYMRREYFRYEVVPHSPPPPKGGAGSGGEKKKEKKTRPPMSDEFVWPHTSGQVIYAVAPHGIYAESVTFFFTLNKQFDKVTTIATSLLFWIPIVREFACLAGAASATSANIAHEFEQGRSIVMLPEGIRSAMHVNDPNGMSKVLRGTGGENEPRKGFIRLALSMADKDRIISIVPVYNAGAEKTYTTYDVFPWLQRRMMRNYMYPWPIFNFGWYGSFWPKPVKITIHVGKPIVCSKDRSVDDIHEEYCSAMEELKNTM